MRIQSINRARAGLTVEGVLGTSCLDYVPPEQRVILESNIKRVFETGESFSYEMQGQGDNNILAWYSTHVSLLNKGRDNEQVMLITEDITERKRAEDYLRKSESYFRDLIDCAGDAIYIVNLTDGRILDCNRSACLALGYSRDEILQLSTFDIEAELPADAVESVHATMRPGVMTHVQGMHRRKDGSIFPVDINLTIMGGPESSLAVSVVRDITELKRLEEERIRQRSEERSMTNLLMDIHDGIGGITSNIALIADLALKLPLQEDLKKKVAAISQLAHDGILEVRSLMYGLDRDDLHWKSIVGALKEQGEKLLAPHQIAFTMTADYEDDIPDPSSHVCLQLFRIYREAIVNVIKHARATKVAVSFRLGRDRLVLEVRDDGRGIVESALAVSGRGISNMIKRAEALSGKTTIKRNGGTCVTVEMPLALKPPPD